MKLPKLNTFSSYNPLVFSDILFHKNKRAELFKSLTSDQQIELLRSVTPGVKRDLLQRVPSRDLIPLLEAVDPDEATDILQLLHPKKRDTVLQLLSVDLKDAISTLLKFDAQSAAGLMTLDYIQVDIGSTIEDTAIKFRQHEKRTGRPPVIVVMQDGKLTGFLPGHELGFARKKDLIARYVKKMPAISYIASHHDVIDMFHSHPHNKIAVLNDNHDVVGIIYSDDALQLLHDSEGASLYDFAGISDEEGVSDSIHNKVKNRYKWLIINLATAFMAAFTVGLFEDILTAFVILAVYMPIVAGMGGNAGTQTLAVVVRGIALRQVSLKTAWPILRNEVGAGLINGLIVGVLVAIVSVLLNQDIRIAVVLALAMVFNLVVATFFGTLVPLIMSRLGKDPATSASIFITTATDVLGFMSFLGLATIILS
jgi:magnesium transporter